jgi:hypothetical protein
MNNRKERKQQMKVLKRATKIAKIVEGKIIPGRKGGKAKGTDPPP